MKFLTCGDRKKPILVMLHGNLTSAKSCYKEILPELKSDYFIILPEIQGLNGRKEKFVSVEDTALQIEQYLLKHYDGEIEGICGLSLGGTLALCLLERGRIKSKRAFIDAAFGIDMGWKAEGYTLLFGGFSQMLRPIEIFPGIKKRLYYQVPAAKIGYFGCGLKNEMRICQSVYHYNVSEKIAQCEAEIRFIYGSLEKYPAQTAERVKRYLPKTVVDVKMGMGHAGYLIDQPKAYAKEIKNWME